MTAMTEALKVRSIPEQARVAAVRLDVIHIRRRFGDTERLTHSTERFLREHERPEREPASGVIPAANVRVRSLVRGARAVRAPS